MVVVVLLLLLLLLLLQVVASGRINLGMCRKHPDTYEAPGQCRPGTAPTCPGSRSRGGWWSARPPDTRRTPGPRPPPRGPGPPPGTWGGRAMLPYLAYTTITSTMINNSITSIIITTNAIISTAITSS